MAGSRGFRFATTSFHPTRADLLADAQKAERLGYDTFVMADHLFNQPAPIPILMMVAERIPVPGAALVRDGRPGCVGGGRVGRGGSCLLPGEP